MVEVEYLFSLAMSGLFLFNAVFSELFNIEIRFLVSLTVQ